MCFWGLRLCICGLWMCVTVCNELHSGEKKRHFQLVSNLPREAYTTGEKSQRGFTAMTIPPRHKTTSNWQLSAHQLHLYLLAGGSRVKEALFSQQLKKGFYCNSSAMIYMFAYFNSSSIILKCTQQSVNHMFSLF